MKRKLYRAFAPLATMLILASGTGMATLVLPGVRGIATADQVSLSASDQDKIEAKCKSALGNPNGLSLQACESGYLLALENESNKACDKPPYKGHAAAVNACKVTGYNLGKKNAAKVDVHGGSPPAKKSPPPSTPCNLDDGCNLIDKYVNPFIDFLSIAFGLIAVISLILGGVQYSTSEGDPQKSSQAKSRISNTILAIFAYMILYAFLQFIIPGGLFH